MKLSGLLRLFSLSDILISIVSGVLGAAMGIGLFIMIVLVLEQLG